MLSRHLSGRALAAVVVAVGCTYFAVDLGFRSLSAGNPAIDPETARLLATTGTLQLVDVRRPGEWQATGLPAGAHGVPLHDADGAPNPAFVDALIALTGGDRGAHVGFICASGVRSETARRLAEKAGFLEAVSVDEGMLGSREGPGWLARGLPVTPCQGC